MREARRLVGVEKLRGKFPPSNPMAKPAPKSPASSASLIAPLRKRRPSFRRLPLLLGSRQVTRDLGLPYRIVRLTSEIYPSSSVT